MTDINYLYIPDSSQQIIETELRVLQEMEESLIKCRQISVNGNSRLIFDTDRYTSITSVLNRANADIYLEKIIRVLISIKDQGFMGYGRVVLDPDKVYVDTLDQSVRLLYIPVYDSVDGKETESDFVGILQGLLQKNEIISSSKNAKKFLKASKQGGISLQGLYDQMFLNNSIKLVSKKHGIVFDIDQDSFAIGKEDRICQGLIADNPAVSRIHCLITKVQGHMYIQDMGSVNGTFLNKNSLMANKRYEFFESDQIRIADVDFQVVQGGDLND